MGEKYEKMIEWLKASNRWKHLAGGFLLGGIAEDWLWLPSLVRELAWIRRH